MNNKTIKFFISSTFKDFLKERNALQNFVFPRLKKICNSKGFSFQPVDLRWGITEKSSEDNKTMLYCLNEVKRCSSEPKPNLLILLGQRYGWGPLPLSITMEECEYIKSKVTNKELERLNEWYIQDLNDIEKKYFLKNKRDLDDDSWRKREKELKDIVQTATKEKKDDEYSHFHTSATEQEIKYALEKQYQSSSANTIVYSREFESGAVDEDLIEGADKPDAPKSKKAQQKLEKLNQYLKSKKSDLTYIQKSNINLKSYQSAQDNLQKYNELTDDLKYFCVKIFSEFGRNILKEINNFDKKSSLEMDLEEQENFLKQKSNTIGRTDEIDTIKDFVIEDSEENFYLLYGKSGIGKTSVMASAISELKDENVIYRFVGTTAHTTSPRDTYEHIYWEIVDKNIDDKLKLNIELDNQKFYKQFYKALEDYGKKLTIFIDAVDQFNDFDSLEIFLNYVPDNVKVVFSCLYDETKTDKKDYTDYYNQLKHLQNNYELKELKDSNKEILNIWLVENNRTLQEKQEDLILEYAKDKTPLYLRLAFEIAKEWKSQDNIYELKSELGESEKELIKTFFENIIKKHDVEDELLSLTLGFISASKDGLSESEIIDILSMDKKILKMYERKDSSYPKLSALPASIFSKMYYHIQDIFTERNIDGEMLINPYHRIVEEVIHEEYYKEEYHVKLADYFYTVQDDKKTWDKRYYNIHMLSEFPYQLFYSKKSEELKEILFDLEFAGSVYNNKKQKSFRDVMSKATRLKKISEVEIYPWESFYREKEHLILKVDEELWRPHQSLFQLAYEDGEESSLTDKAKFIIENEKVDWYFITNRIANENFYRTGIEVIIGDINLDDTYDGVEIFENKVLFWNYREIKVYLGKKLVDKKEIDDIHSCILINNIFVVLRDVEIEIFRIEEVLVFLKSFNLDLKTKKINDSSYSINDIVDIMDFNKEGSSLGDIINYQYGIKDEFLLFTRTKNYVSKNYVLDFKNILLDDSKFDFIISELYPQKVINKNVIEQKKLEDIYFDLNKEKFHSNYKEEQDNFKIKLNYYKSTISLYSERDNFYLIDEKFSKESEKVNDLSTNYILFKNDILYFTNSDNLFLSYNKKNKEINILGDFNDKSNYSYLGNTIVFEDYIVLISNNTRILIYSTLDKKIIKEHTLKLEGINLYEIINNEYILITNNKSHLILLDKNFNIILKITEISNLSYLYNNDCIIVISNKKDFLIYDLNGTLLSKYRLNNYLQKYKIYKNYILLVTSCEILGLDTKCLVSSKFRNKDDKKSFQVCEDFNEKWIITRDDMHNYFFYNGKDFKKININIDITDEYNYLTILSLYNICIINYKKLIKVYNKNGDFIKDVDFNLDSTFTISKLNNQKFFLYNYNNLFKIYNKNFEKLLKINSNSYGRLLEQIDDVAIFWLGYKIIIVQNNNVFEYVCSLIEPGVKFKKILVDCSTLIIGLGGSILIFDLQKFTLIKEFKFTNKLFRYFVKKENSLVCFFSDLYNEKLILIEIDINKRNIILENCLEMTHIQSHENNIIAWSQDGMILVDEKFENVLIQSKQMGSINSEVYAYKNFIMTTGVVNKIWDYEKDNIIVFNSFNKEIKFNDNVIYDYENFYYLMKGNQLVELVNINNQENKN